MLKRQVLMAFFVATTSYCSGQQASIDRTVPVVKLNFLSPSFSYEHPTSKLQTVQLQTGVAFSTYFSYFEGQPTRAGIDPFLFLQGQYRFYYGLKKRQEKKRFTRLNSMNYVAPFYNLNYSAKSFEDAYERAAKRREINSLGALWGLQRNFKGRFSLDLNMGIGYMFSKADYNTGAGIQTIKANDFYIPVQLQLGIWLNKRKDK